MATNSDIATLTGLSPAWKGARIGRLASEILLGDTASPFFVLDEIDKLSNWGATAPHDVLLTLLEAETARTFRDELLDLPFRADRAFWALTSNNRDTLPAPLTDRLLIVDIPELDGATKARIAADLFRHANRDHNDVFDAPSTDTLEAIAKAGLRDAKRTILLAMGIAIRDERANVEPDDIAAAQRIQTETTAPKRRIGF
jgi:ATP-dependent Lon protease